MSEETIVMDMTGEDDHPYAEAIAGVRRVDPRHKTRRIDLTIDTQRTTLEAAQEKIEQVMGWQTRELAVNTD